MSFGLLLIAGFALLLVAGQEIATINTAQTIGVAAIGVAAAIGAAIAKN